MAMVRLFLIRTGFGIPAHVKTWSAGNSSTHTPARAGLGFLNLGRGRAGSIAAVLVVVYLRMRSLRTSACRKVRASRDSGIDASTCARLGFLNAGAVAGTIMPMTPRVSVGGRRKVPWLHVSVTMMPFLDVLAAKAAAESKVGSSGNTGVKESSR